MNWDVSKVSKRFLSIKEVDNGNPISGHDGEWLGVMIGALGSFIKRNNIQRVKEIDEWIHNELQRESKAFNYLTSLKSSPQVDTAMLKLAAIMTHNVGDVDQGLSYWNLNNTDATCHRFDYLLIILNTAIIIGLWLNTLSNIVDCRMNGTSGMVVNMEEQRSFTSS